MSIDSNAIEGEPTGGRDEDESEGEDGAADWVRDDAADAELAGETGAQWREQGFVRNVTFVSGFFYLLCTVD